MFLFSSFKNCLVKGFTNIHDFFGSRKKYIYITFGKSFFPGIFLKSNHHHHHNVDIFSFSPEQNDDPYVCQYLLCLNTFLFIQPFHLANREKILVIPFPLSMYILSMKLIFFVKIVKKNSKQTYEIYRLN